MGNPTNMQAPLPYRLTVNNGPVNVGSICLVGVSSSSALLLGDTESITLYSFFDTPPESVIVGPLAPLPAPPEEDLE
ncbi:spore gernimation protein GerPD [Cohnella mopanensis]|uniref:spore gernimation protein GerPD n=1 Tax=Cohnella mopanensis TaxID=2911966 RepID=UPI00272EC616|nr:spore gernimation protein GerPD [Cohnella mopanensis]